MKRGFPLSSGGGDVPNGNYKGLLNQAVGRKCKKAITATDIVYITNQPEKGGGYISTIAFGEMVGPVLGIGDGIQGDECQSKKLAEASAAREALAALGILEDGQGGGGQMAAATSGPQNYKGLLHQAVGKACKRALAANDIHYVTMPAEYGGRSSFVSTVSFSDQAGEAIQISEPVDGMPTKSKKDAEHSAAWVALEMLGVLQDEQRGPHEEITEDATENFKNLLHQAVGKRCKRALISGDISFSTNLGAGGGFVSNCIFSEPVAQMIEISEPIQGNTCNSKKLAEQSAARHALEQVSAGMPLAKRLRSSAPGAEPEDPMKELAMWAEQAGGLGLQYSVEKVGMKFKATVNFGVAAHMPAVSAEGAKQEAALAALKLLASFANPEGGGGGADGEADDGFDASKNYRGMFVQQLQQRCKKKGKKVEDGTDVKYPCEPVEGGWWRANVDLSSLEDLGFSLVTEPVVAPSKKEAIQRAAFSGLKALEN